MLRNTSFLVLLVVSITSPGCGPADTVTIQGCGATFPAPMYKRWFLEFYKQHPNIRVNYQAIGSGAGVQQFEEGLVQFGATDDALDEKKLKDIAKKLDIQAVLQIPLTGGSIALCYNLPGIDPATNLKLTRKAYIDMLLGKITYWDDPAIYATNPTVNLPHLEMTFIRRADSSGTTAVFTIKIKLTAKEIAAHKSDKTSIRALAFAVLDYPKEFSDRRIN